MRERNSQLAALDDEENRNKKIRDLRHLTFQVSVITCPSFRATQVQFTGFKQVQNENEWKETVIFFNVLYIVLGSAVTTTVV